MEIQPGNQTVSPNHPVQTKTQQPNESRAGGATPRQSELTHQDAAAKIYDAEMPIKNPTSLARKAPTIIDPRRRKAEKPTKPNTERRRKEPSAAGGVRRRGRGRTNYKPPFNNSHRFTPDLAGSERIGRSNSCRRRLKKDPSVAREVGQPAVGAVIAAPGHNLLSGKA